jgi:hypothetical protein
MMMIRVGQTCQQQHREHKVTKLNCVFRSKMQAAFVHVKRRLLPSADRLV